MKIALISDIHGNYKALEAFLGYLESNPVDGIIALGDYVTDSPYPERTMDLIYSMMDKYTCYMIRGNREDYLLTNDNNCKGWKPSSPNGALFYTWQHTRPEDLNFFASIPTEREVAIDGCEPFYICHGTPGSVRGNVTIDTNLKDEVLANTSYKYILGGHSHHQEIHTLEDKIYVNPGSLGIAMDGVGGIGQFAILTSVNQADVNALSSWQVELQFIEYDLQAFLEDYSKSGLDEYGMTLNKAIKKTLATGTNYFIKCVHAMEEESNRRGFSSITEISEDEWKKLK